MNKNIANLCIILILALICEVFSECNITRYEVWLEEEYTGSLLKDETVWGYDALDLTLSNRVMLQMVTKRCIEQFKLISEEKSGFASSFC